MEAPQVQQVQSFTTNWGGQVAGRIYCFYWGGHRANTMYSTFTLIDGWGMKFRYPLKRESFVLDFIECLGFIPSFGVWVFVFIYCLWVI